MTRPIITLPSTSGFMVEWETGITMRNGKKLKDMFCTRSKEKAEAVAKEKEAAGFQNVKIFEAIF